MTADLERDLDLAANARAPQTAVVSALEGGPRNAPSGAQRGRRDAVPTPRPQPRPVAEAEVKEQMAFYRKGRAQGDFDAGITMAVAAVLTNPKFLFRVETDSPKGGVYRISDLELATRLSFFLWSSIPDDELLDAAVKGKLSQPAELERQTRRMLADGRSRNLATNFAGQWLRLRNIDSVIPSGNLFRDFDDNLRQAFRSSTSAWRSTTACPM